jgi:hypothetical protein
MGKPDFTGYPCVAATAFIALSSALCVADTIQVTYTTTGTFTAGDSGATAVGGVLTKTQGNNVSSLSFSGTTQSYPVDFDQVFEDVILGSFITQTNNANIDFGGGASFTLSITQFLPEADGPGLITTESIQGKIRNDGVTLDFDDSLQFPDPSQIGKPTIVYTPNDITLSAPSTSPFMLTGDIDAIPAAVVVPLPPAVLGGAALIGCVGFAQVFRRTRAAAQ